MMGLSKMIKTNAKRSLAGSWGAAIGVLVITALPSIVINVIEYAIRKVTGIAEYMDYAETASVAFDDMANVSLISTLISVLIALLIFFINTPLQQGNNRWFYRRTGGEQDSVSSVFFYFESAKQYFRTLGLYFQIGIRMFLWMLLPTIPMIAFIAFMGIANVMMGTDTPSSAGAIFMILAIVWTIILVIISVIISLRYFLAPYILAEHPEQKASKCIKDSVKMVKGHKAELFVFMLSFIGWELLCLFIIPLFYVIPYMNASFAMYARYLIQLGENGENSDNRTKEYIYKPDIDRYMEEQKNLSNEAPEQNSQPIEQSNLPEL